MDTAIRYTGDFAVDVNERPYFITGQDERRQQLYWRLSMVRGGSLYDRTTGSDLSAIDLSRADAVLQAEAQARKALADLPGAEVTGVSLENGTLTVFVQWDGQDYEIPVRREAAT